MTLGLLISAAIAAAIVTFVFCALRLSALADRDVETGLRRFEDRR
jgi:hypothetical protein